VYNNKSVAAVNKTSGFHQSSIDGTPYADKVNFLKPASPHWQILLRQAAHDPAALLQTLALSSAECAVDMTPSFAMRIPPAYLAAITPGDKADPLLRQVLPLNQENEPSPGFCSDPTGDVAARTAPGLLHKYQGRALIITTTVCAIHCRYCFRRHYPYRDLPMAWQNQVIAHIQRDSSIHEIILSGGDPLVLSTSKLAQWFSDLSAIAHIRRIRIHTRVPVVLPQRIDNSLLEIIRHSPLPVTVVIHANHPRELNPQARSALAHLRQAGAWLFNQSVLLHGVNDDASVLHELSEVLGECQVVPYYLHFLDPVHGAAHFAVTPAHAHALLQQLRLSLPGYLVPKLVREQIGAPYKQAL
jgi:L-lysine 2,3-aminomutase